MTAKFDPERATEAQQWIEQVTGMQFDSDFHESLQSGVLLCELINKLEPGTIAKINKGKMPFMQMENIATYIEASKKLGVPDQYNFMTVDLYEKKNLGQVVQNLITLKRIKGFGFEKVDASQGGPSSAPGNGRDQTTEAKSQRAFVSSDPQSMATENDLKRTGPAMMTGRHDNEVAMKCPVCTKFITSGAVNALGKAWHPNCFTCKKCNVKLSTTKYYEHNNAAYCDRCILMVKPQTSVHAASSDKGFQFNK